MATIPHEPPPITADIELQDYLNRMISYISIAVEQNNQLPKLSVLPDKPSTGKIYFFTRAIPSTPITSEGYWGYTSAGYVKLG